MITLGANRKDFFIKNILVCGVAAFECTGCAKNID
jgi:hypothetical protein